MERFLKKPLGHNTVVDLLSDDDDEGSPHYASITTNFNDEISKNSKEFQNFEKKVQKRMKIGEQTQKKMNFDEKKRRTKEFDGKLEENIDFDDAHTCSDVETNEGGEEINEKVQKGTIFNEKTEKRMNFDEKTRKTKEFDEKLAAKMNVQLDDDTHSMGNLKTNDYGDENLNSRGRIDGKGQKWTNSDEKTQKRMNFDEQIVEETIRERRMMVKRIICDSNNEDADKIKEEYDGEKKLDAKLKINVKINVKSFCDEDCNARMNFKTNADCYAEMNLKTDVNCDAKTNLKPDVNDGHAKMNLKTDDVVTNDGNANMNVVKTTFVAEMNLKSEYGNVKENCNEETEAAVIMRTTKTTTWAKMQSYDEVVDLLSDDDDETTSPMSKSNVSGAAFADPSSANKSAGAAAAAPSKRSISASKSRGVGTPKGSSGKTPFLPFTTPSPFANRSFSKRMPPTTSGLTHPASIWGGYSKSRVSHWPAYTARFVWFDDDFARWPGSGHYAFDSTRRQPMKSKPDEGEKGKEDDDDDDDDHGDEPVSSSSAHPRNDHVKHTIALVLQHTTPSTRQQLGIDARFESLIVSSELPAVAHLFYKRKPKCWSRLDRLKSFPCDDAGIQILSQLDAVFVSPPPQSTAAIRECYELLLVEELKSVLSDLPTSQMIRKLKRDLVEVLVHRSKLPLHVNADFARLVEIIQEKSLFTQAAVIALQPWAFESMLRLHQYVFSQANLEPEDAVEFLRNYRLPVLAHDWAAAGNTVSASPSPFCSECWVELKSRLDDLALFCTCVPDEDESTTYSVLHECVTSLMETRNCCWMRRRADLICLRVVYVGINLLEREKKYPEAIHYLKCSLEGLKKLIVLTNPDTFINFHRCKLMLRLVTDLGHLGNDTQALELLEEMLNEPNGIVWSPSITSGSTCVGSRNRLGGVGASLISKCLGLSKPPRRWVFPSHLEIIPLPEEHIECNRVQGKSVEDAALEQHYLKTWSYGQHCENGLLHTLFGLMFFECCGDSPQGSSRAFSPVTMHSSFFQDSIRRPDALKILTNILEGSAPELIRNSWQRYHERQICGVNWSRNSLPDLERIARSMGSKTLHLVCSLFLDAYKAWCGGLSDLFLWNDDEVKFVEIKGPGDSLSDRQKAWGEKLVGVGANAVVCYVKWSPSKSGTVGMFVTPSPAR